MRSIMQEKLDVDNLWETIIISCSCYGADADDPDVLQSRAQ